MQWGHLGGQARTARVPIDGCAVVTITTVAGSVASNQGLPLSSCLTSIEPAAVLQPSAGEEQAWRR
jgi:hypothetical protein